MPAQCSGLLVFTHMVRRNVCVTQFSRHPHPFVSHVHPQNLFPHALLGGQYRIWVGLVLLVRTENDDRVNHASLLDVGLDDGQEGDRQFVHEYP